MSRRALLGTAAGVGAGATSGCLQALGDVLGTGVPGQLSLTVKTVPADSDTIATRIGRRLVKHLNEVGVDARVELQPAREIRKDTLINNDFDIYVGQYPDRHDPDFLRPALHSVFEGEIGWQNPFSFTDITVDDYLSGQRAQAGDQRTRTVTQLQQEVASKQPFGIVALPDEIWAARTDRFTGLSSRPLTRSLSFITLDASDDDRADEFRVTTTNSSPTRNLNPLSVQHRLRGIFTGLLYDPVARRIDGEVLPWLAESWDWERDDGDAVGDILLREDLSWHDGEDLTADDVAFTYRFLRDTALGETNAPVPAPRFRGRSSLVGEVTVETDRGLKLRCPDTSPAVAARALTVPVFPEHVWRERSSRTSVAWANGDRYMTQAMVWPNPRPVGSGVVQFGGRAQGESLVLQRFDDHFLHREATPELPEEVADGVAYDRLSVRIVPSHRSGVQLLTADEADATAMSIDPAVVPSVGEDDDLALHVADGRLFYHIGFNTQREPLGNPHVRRAIVRLLDKGNIVEEVFDGYARPATSPLSGTDWLPTALAWNGEDPEVPFVGSDGNLDVSQAKDLFRDAGLEYSDEGRLLDR